MKFSVIIPVYNCEAYLHRCIDSIVCQPFNDYELILIDDGSTDASYTICKEYAEQYPCIKLIHQENSGPSVARNRGLDEASGEFLLFVDSDDYVSRDYFSVLDQAISEPFPDILMFGCIGTLTGVSATEKRTVTGNKNIIDFYSSSCYNLDYNSCCNKCFKRTPYYRNLHFTKNTVVEEDLLFNLYALDKAESIRFIDAPLYYYNQRSSGSVTTKYNPTKFDSTVSAYEKKMQFAMKWKNTQIANFYKTKFITYISASINNLIYQSCPLGYSEKIAQIKRMYLHPYTMDCVNSITATSARTKLMRFLIKYKLYRTSYFIHYSVFHLKRRK